MRPDGTSPDRAAISAALDEALFAAPASRPGPIPYALLDGAAFDNLPRALHETGAEAVCLYKGSIAPEVMCVAPYLAVIERGHPLYERLLDGWGRAQAVFLIAEDTLISLRGHFRKLTMVRLPDERVVYFRFYDPRVMRTVMPVLDARQRAALFGPAVRAFLCEGEGAGLPVRLVPDPVPGPTPAAA